MRNIIAIINSKPLCKCPVLGPFLGICLTGKWLFSRLRWDKMRKRCCHWRCSYKGAGIDHIFSLCTPFSNRPQIVTGNVPTRMSGTMYSTQILQAGEIRSITEDCPELDCCHCVLWHDTMEHSLDFSVVSLCRGRLTEIWSLVANALGNHLRAAELVLNFYD